MSTSALIKTPWGAEYLIEADGYPKEVVPYLRDMVEDAKEYAEEEYKDPEGKWVRELKLEMEERCEGMYSELIKTNRPGSTNYKYRVNEDGTVEYRKDRNEEWQEYSE